MWLARPLYESLPYVYAAAGIASLAASGLASMPAMVSTILLVLGVPSLLIGMVLGLRRWDYRRQRAQYNSRLLDEVENA
jgi:uncharacterized membrane protein YtjA (UPF0391 family)